MPGGSTVSPSPPYGQQMICMRGIVTKILVYVDDHTPAEIERLRSKSVDGLVAMEVFTPEDAAYLREHQIAYPGYDPGRVSGDGPLLEAQFPQTAPRWRIVIRGDGSAMARPVQDSK